MKLEMRNQMRLEQKMKLAPRMIQSMEFLQLPMLALQERIEQELNGNPVLELEEPAGSEDNTDAQQDRSEAKVQETAEGAEDFDRLENLDDGYYDYMDRSSLYYRRGSSDEDKKLEALKNTAALPASLHDYLTEQWHLVEAKESVKKAGNVIIDYIDEKGYLSVRLEQLQNKDCADFSMRDLEEALDLVQKLEPAGVGARDVKECLLIQLYQQNEDLSFEAALLTEHMDKLLSNRLPDIVKKMNCSLERVNLAIERISRFDTSPGLQISQSRNHRIVADVIVEYLEEQGDFSVRLADSNFPNLRINSYYAQMVKKPATNAKTKKFLHNNIRSARWIIEAIEQRKSTLLRVTRAVVKCQKDFFEKGQLYLHPLPMSKIADEVGVHLGTVSRAVAGKYVQCSWGVLPLRKFFSGGTEDVEGNTRSWAAIRASLQQIIDSEDKSRPLSDDQIRQKLAEAGITNLARRTVAKYRKLMNIPVSRFRKKY
ncbi:MAG: RNA polymerase factor sigma-54 [Planctomycetota bacterium]|jgi:RNA polymerase sigma-54 factor